VGVLLLTMLLTTYSYELGTVLGRPDTIKLLVSPQKVVERGDTIVVLDEERPAHLTVKHYTLDGFFIRERPYAPATDSGLFAGLCRAPDSVEARRLAGLVDDELYPEWKRTAAGPDGATWLVYSWIMGDGGGLTLAKLSGDGGSVAASGYGPSELDFRIGSMRDRLVHDSRDWPVFLSIGQRYVYLIASDFLWQYDQQARFIRKVGIDAEGCFKEPVGIALGPDGEYVTDFRLGRVWQHSAKYRSSWRRLPEEHSSPLPEPESPTYLCTGGEGRVWVTNVLAPGLRLLGFRSFREFAFGRQWGVDPEGHDFRVALKDSLLVCLAYTGGLHRVFIYDTLGRFVRTLGFESNEEHKADALVGLDNTGTIYGEMSFPHRMFRLSLDGEDTTWLQLPDSTRGHQLSWLQTWRVADTLYVLGQRFVGRDSPPAHCVFVFVADRFSHMIDESEFEDGLRGYFTDMAMDADGDFWFVDIWDRTVREYRQKHN